MLIFVGIFLINSVGNSVLIQPAFAQTACQSPPAGLIGWWTADGHYDDIIGGNNGNPRYGVPFAQGIAGQAFSFDGLVNGSDARVEVGAQVLPITAGTVETWFKFTGNITPGGPSKALTGTYNGISFGPTLYISSDPDHLGNLAWQFSNLSEVTSEHINQNQWYHVALTYDNQYNVTIYLDGIQVASGTASTPQKFADVFFIGGYISAQLPFEGLIDEFSIYDHALTAQEVYDIFTAGSAGKCKPNQGQHPIIVPPPPSGPSGLCVTPPTGLISWWDGDNSADDLVDGNNGSLVGGTGFASGYLGPAFSFDGIDDAVVTSSQVYLSSGGTVEFWFKSFASPPFGIGNLIPSLTGNAGYGGGFLQIAPTLYLHTDPDYWGDLTWEFGNLQSRNTLQHIALNQWYHAAVTYDSQYRVKVYLNGVLVSSAIALNRPTAFFGNVVIGNHGYSNSPFNGLIDEYSIYNHPLPANEIQTIFEAGTAGKCKPNRSPVVSTIMPSTNPAQVNTTITADANFTDLDLLDTHTAVWDWGDGTSPGTVTESNGSGSVTGSHTYSTPGVYTLKLTVTDNNGGSGESIFQYIVVYDPDGGFVTGAGTINSPVGAYTLDTSLSGKAIFGFVSKYQPGANVPTGNTRFKFHASGLDFQSTNYDWLVVSGPRGQFKGSGKINNQGDYGFILTAIDGQVNGGGNQDKFRIKIWDMSQSSDGSAGVIYDNQIGASDTSDPTTVISSGSITIQK